jgi:hypothetical protein
MIGAVLRWMRGTRGASRDGVIADRLMNVLLPGTFIVHMPSRMDRELHVMEMRQNRREKA